MGILRPRKACVIITRSEGKVDRPLTYMDTIHYDILAIETVTMLGTTKPI